MNSIALSLLGVVLFVAVVCVTKSYDCVSSPTPPGSQKTNCPRRFRFAVTAALAGTSVALFALSLFGVSAVPRPQAQVTRSLLPAHSMLRRTEFALRNSKTRQHDDLRAILLRAGDATAFVAFAPAQQRVAAARTAATRVRALERALANRSDAEAGRVRTALSALADALQRYDIAGVSAAIDARVALEAELWPGMFDMKTSK